SVVNSVLISREMPVFPGFLEIIRVVIKKTKEENINNITVPLVIALSALILFNLITAVPTILAKVNTFTQANENTNIILLKDSPIFIT
ncbi:hypothetical protein AAAV70_29610, partial [Hungatella hathewayi]|uniref:hypothetical protein n=1 Tax=Hungatella hathewayi TaxID=154046 RepID=UPI0032C02C7D